MKINTDQYEELNKITKRLMKSYEKLVSEIEQTVNKDNVSSAIPRYIFPFQHQIHKLMELYINLDADIDQLKVGQMVNLKMKRHKYSGINLNATEQKMIVSSDDTIAMIEKYKSNIENDMKFFETAIDVLKSYSFQISNIIEWKKLVG